MLLLVLGFLTASLVLIVVKTFALIIGAGILIAAALYGRKEAAKQTLRGQRSDDIASLLGISPLEFERHVAETYRRQGYDVELTRSSGDQGVDVIATAQGQRLGIQCKRYVGVVGNDAVQQAHAGKSYYGCSQAIVVTTGTFTPSARALAEKTGVQLVDGKTYSDMLRSLREPASMSGTAAWLPQGRPLAVQLSLVIVALAVFSTSLIALPNLSNLFTAPSNQTQQGKTHDPNYAPQTQTQAAQNLDDRVIAFYHALNGHDFKSAWAMLSDSFRQSGTYQSWKTDYTTTKSIDVSVTPLTTDTVSVSMTAVDVTSAGSVTRHFAGTWKGVVGSDGQWYLDSGHFTVVPSRSNVAVLEPETTPAGPLAASQSVSLNQLKQTRSPDRQALQNELSLAEFQINLALSDLNPALNDLDSALSINAGPAEIRSRYDSTWSKMQQDWQKEQAAAAVSPMTCNQKSQVQYLSSQVAYELSQIKYNDSQVSYLRSLITPNLHHIQKGLASYLKWARIYDQRLAACSRYFGADSTRRSYANAASQLTEKAHQKTNAARSILDDLATVEASFDSQGRDLTAKAKQFADTLECDG